MTHLVETEVRNEVKEELEMFMRGKFQGGEFIFRIFMDNGTYFTNQDYFENRKNFLANIDEEHFVKIELVSDDQAMQKLLVNQMHPSVSIIQISQAKQTKTQHPSHHRNQHHLFNTKTAQEKRDQQDTTRFTDLRE